MQMCSSWSGAGAVGSTPFLLSSGICHVRGALPDKTRGSATWVTEARCSQEVTQTGHKVSRPSLLLTLPPSPNGWCSKTAFGNGRANLLPRLVVVTDSRNLDKIV